MQLLCDRVPNWGHSNLAVYFQISSWLRNIHFLLIPYICSKFHQNHFPFTHDLSKVSGNAAFCSQMWQWWHQGEMGAFALPVGGSAPPPPLAPPSEGKKWPKSAIFSKFVDFCPLRITFCPPQKKILVPPHCYWCSLNNIHQMMV